MTRKEAQTLCETLAMSAIGTLRASNETWDRHHGVASSVSDAEYEQAFQEVANALWRRTGFTGSRLAATLPPTASSPQGLTG